MQPNAESAKPPPEPGKPNLSALSTFERSIRVRSGEKKLSEPTRSLAREMAEHLDEYVARLEASRPDNGFRRTANFFVSNASYGITPIERMASIYETVPKKEGEGGERQAIAIKLHAQKMLEGAFDQHHENPEKYVSHGFDHSIRVADYAQAVLRQEGLGILPAATSKYGITEGEARFLVELVSFYHDMGYPLLQGRSKAFHGIAAAEMIGNNDVRGLFYFLLPSLEKQNYDQAEILFDDLRDSALYHGADKIEGDFFARIRTSKGELLLADPEHAAAAVAILGYLKEMGIPYREIPVITVPSSEDEKSFSRSYDPQYYSSRGLKPITPRVIVDDTTDIPRGRHISLGDEDATIGLEFKMADEASPFLAVLRIADNMDSSRERLSELQQEPAFIEIYEIFGNNGSESRRLQELELAARAIGDGSDLRALEVYKALLIDRTLADPKYLESFTHEPVLQGRIKEIAMGQNSESLRHFAGCEAIEAVGIVGSTIIVSVISQRFQELNNIRVLDKTGSHDGVAEDIDLGAGEYQIWRIREAIKSIKLNSKDLHIKVIDEKGQEVGVTFQL